MTSTPTEETTRILAELPRTKIHTAAQMFQADAFTVEHEGEKIVIKCFADRPWLVRKTLAKFVISHEAHIYNRLRGVPGVPKFYGQLPGPALAVQWLPQTRIPDQRDADIPQEFFDKLDALFARVHEAGVAHGDVRRTNVAINHDGEPHLIDFASAITNKSLWPVRLMFRRMCVSDNLSSLRLRMSYHPDMEISPEQQALLDSEPALLKFGRFFRQRIYKPFRAKFIKEYDS